MEQQPPKDILFVIGAPKTGTSSMLRMLNAHPDIFILFETLIGKFPNDRYAARFLETYPDARKLFYYGVTPDKFFPCLREFLAEKGYNFKIVGNNAPEHGMEADRLKTIADYKTIYMIRDVRTWAAKEHVVREYFAKNNVAHLVVDYTICFLKSFTMPYCTRVRLEDIIYHNEAVLDKLSVFLEIALLPHLNEWWRVGHKGDKHPKNSQRWQSGHPSASYGPRGAEDTSVELASHVFWDKLLPVFDKYFQGIDKSFSVQEIEADMNTVKRLGDFSPLPLGDAYVSYRTVHLAPTGVLPKLRVKKFVKKLRNWAVGVAKAILGKR